MAGDSEQGLLNKIDDKEKGKEGWIIASHFALNTAERLLPGEIVGKAWQAVQSQGIHVPIPLVVDNQIGLIELGHKAKALEEAAKAGGRDSPALYYAAALVYDNCGYLYREFYNKSYDAATRRDRLVEAIRCFDLSVRSAQNAVKVWRGRDAAGMKPPGPPVAEFLAAPPAGGRRRMKNPCWKGYKAYGMKRTRKGKVPNCVPRKTRRRHK